MRWSVIWIGLVLVVSCGDSGEGGSKSRRDRDDKDDKDDKKGKLSCEDAVDGFTRDKDRKADLVRSCIKHEWSRRMKKCVSEAESRADYRACERKHDDGRSSQIWDKMDAYANKICACNDMDCITKAGEQWAKDAAEYTKSSTDSFRDMTEDDKKRSEEITKKITECTKRVTDEMMRKAGGDSTGW